MSVHVDENIHGVSINPLMTKSFDGDFDGDPVGLVMLPQPESGEESTWQHRTHNQAMDRLSVEANLVDMGVLTKAPGVDYPVHPLFVHTGSDVATGLPLDLSAYVVEANNIAEDLLQARGRNQRQALLSQAAGLVDALSTEMRDAMLGMSQRHGLRYSTLQEHLISIEQTCIDTGAKGSLSALADYASYVGVDADGRDLGEASPKGGVRLAAQGVNIALVVKKAVGIPGRISQRAVAGLRDTDLSAALELTYPCTQALMQAKHDPDSALQKYNVMQTAARDLWRGHLLNPDAGFEVFKDDDGQPMRANRDQWVAQALALYRSPSGLNIPAVDPAWVEQAADALSDEEGLMVNIESL